MSSFGLNTHSVPAFAAVATSADRSISVAAPVGRRGRVWWLRPPVLILSTIVLLLYLPGATWGLPNEYVVSTNAEAPYDSLEFVGLYTNAKAAAKYPAVQPLLTLPIYAAVILGHKLAGDFTSISSTWPYGFKDPYVGFSHLILARNLMSVVMAIGLLLTFTRLPFPTLSMWGKYIAAAFLATSGIFTYFARVSNPDIPYLFWWSLSFLFIARYVYSHGGWRKNLILSAAFSALAIGTKDQAAGLVFGSGIVILVVGRKDGGRIPPRVKDAAFFSLCMLSTYLVVAVLPQPFRWIEHLKTWLPSAPGVADYVQFPATPEGYGGLLGAAAYRLMNDLSPATLVLAAIGLVFLVRGRHGAELVLLLVPVIAYYLLIITPIRFVWERYMLPVAYIAVILAGVGTAEGFKVLQARSRLLTLPVVAAVIGTLGYQALTGYFATTQMQLADVRRQLTTEASSIVPPGTKVLFIDSPFLRTLPNSDFYRKYQLVLPAGVAVPLRYKHAVSEYDPGWQFVLSREPLSNQFGDLTLLRTFIPPDDGALEGTGTYWLYRR